MTMAISKALERGPRGWCAPRPETLGVGRGLRGRCGAHLRGAPSRGYIALGKLAQALIHGARVLQIRGNFDEALERVRELPCVRRSPSSTPSTRTASRGRRPGRSRSSRARRRPRHPLHPVGNAGNITAYWRGYCEYRQDGRASKLPRMLGFQAAGAAPIVLGHKVDAPDTIATAIRIGNPASWYSATAAAAESGGAIDSVTDDEILEAYRYLASTSPYSASRRPPRRWPAC